ncbi:hypothetical protein, partial [Shigella flexneri]
SQIKHSPGNPGRFILISHIYPDLEYRGIVLFCSTIFITFTQNILRLVSSLLMMFYHACKGNAANLLI